MKKILGGVFYIEKYFKEILYAKSRLL